MSNKTLYMIIVVLLLVIAAGAAYFIGSRQAVAPSNSGEAPQISGTVSSGQADQAKFGEYFTNIVLEKLPAGAQFSPSAVAPSSVFNLGAGDEFCVSLDVKKPIAAGAYTEVFYDPSTQTYPIAKQTSPRPLSIGNNLGCEGLKVGPSQSLPAGHYEYQVYVDGVLADVLPFEVQ